MKKLIILIALALLIGIGWWLGSPLFINNEINEDFPISSGNNISNENKERMTLEEFDTMLNLPSEEEILSMNNEEKKELEEKIQKKAANLPDIIVMESTIEKTHEPTPPAKPVLLRQGQFFDADSFHKGSGTVKLFKMPDGAHLVRLENFSVTNGPDLFVYLTHSKGATTSKQVKPGYNAGRLKGNKGNQNYIIPASVDVSSFQGISIYCRAFSTLFSSAALK